MEQTNKKRTIILSNQLKENPLAVKMTLKQDKTCGGRLRWNLIINFAMLAMAGFPFYLPLSGTLGVLSFYASLWILFMILEANT